MKKGRVGWILIGLLLVGQLTAQPIGVLNQITDTVACRKWVDEQLQSMTLKQKIGQLFIHTVAPVITQKNKENIATAIKEYGIGGLLFSGGDVQKQVQLTNLAQRQSKNSLVDYFRRRVGTGYAAERNSFVSEKPGLGMYRTGFVTLYLWT